MSIAAAAPQIRSWQAQPHNPTVMAHLAPRRQAFIDRKEYNAALHEYEAAHRLDLAHIAANAASRVWSEVLAQRP